MRSFSRLTCIGVLSLIVFPGSVPAATAPGSVGVSTIVPSSCNVATLPLAFGIYSSTAQVTQTTTLTVTCTTGTTYILAMDAGLGGGTTTTRKMSGPSGSLLNYGIFKDAGNSQNWGNVPGTDTLAGTGSGLLQTISVYGLIPTGQTLTGGSYTDTVTVSMTY